MFSAGRVLLMPKGAYNPLTTYEMLDIVSYNGSSYIAKGTTTGNLPTDTTYWQLSAYGGQAANMAGNFAELESSSVATAIHYVDDIFVDENSQLMKATQTINIGDTIDANVNCAPTTVEALIAYLSSYVDSLDSLNKKIQGAIEIAVQTDLHSLAIGEYYKKQTTFYVTNAPTGINQEASATFRLTVEAALDNASQASSPLLLTLRTPDGVVYTQGFDGSAWGSWVEVASAASVSALNTAKQPKTLDTPITVGGVQQTTVEGALGSINQTLTNVVANMQGVNLIDNPWFTVNQRGQASYNSGYAVDRWTVGYGEVICNVTNNGITLSSTIEGSNFIQFIEENYYNNYIAGKTVTLSILLSDGTIKTITGVAPINTSGYQNIGVLYVHDDCTLTMVGKTGENEQIQIRFTEANSDPVSIRAVKLELGSVSTLAQDTAPNYQQELAKCQRYFQCLRGSLGMGFFKVADAVECVCPIPVPMRATPTATITNNVGIVADDAYSAYATGINLWGEFPDSCIGFDLTGFSHAAGSVCRLFTNNGGAINLSADL